MSLFQRALIGHRQGVGRPYELHRFPAANSIIGKAGKAIARSVGVTLGQHPWYLLVGPYGKRGWAMHPHLQRALEELGLVRTTGTSREAFEGEPTEERGAEEGVSFREGSVIQTVSNRYERNQSARLEAIRHHGAICQACGFDFGEVYGGFAEGYIQVHHLVPLSTIGADYELNPKTDLIPLCANCHVAVHLEKPPIKVSKLKERLMRRLGNGKRERRRIR